MFYDDGPEKLPWDYFLTDYERDLLTMNLEEVVRKNPDKMTGEIRDEMQKLKIIQAFFEANR